MMYKVQTKKTHKGLYILPRQWHHPMGLSSPKGTVIDFDLQSPEAHQESIDVSEEENKTELHMHEWTVPVLYGMLHIVMLQTLPRV